MPGEYYRELFYNTKEKYPESLRSVEFEDLGEYTRDEFHTLRHNMKREHQWLTTYQQSITEVLKYLKAVHVRLNEPLLRVFINRENFHLYKNDVVLELEGQFFIVYAKLITIEIEEKEQRCIRILNVIHRKRATMYYLSLTGDTYCECRTVGCMCCNDCKCIKCKGYKEGVNMRKVTNCFRVVETLESVLYAYEMKDGVVL